MSFEISLGSLAAFALIFLIDAATPGLTSTAVAARSAAFGFRRTTPFIAGVVFGDIVLFLIAVAGLVAAAVALGPLFAVLKWLGVAYLVYAAVKLWRRPITLDDTQPAPREKARGFAFGALLQIGNPKAIVFFAAVLPVAVDVQTLAAADVIALTLVIVVTWGGCLVAFALAADRARRAWSNDRFRLWLNRSSAGAMLGAAGVVASRDL